jgi:hypothetical protein
VRRAKQFSGLELTKYKKADLRFLGGVCEDLRRFGEHPDARTVQQFLVLRDVSWDCLKEMVLTSQEVRDSYAYMIECLHCRWLDFGMTGSQLTRTQAEIVKKYLNLYDELYIEFMQKSLTVAKETRVRYSAENYASYPLEAQYKEIYDSQRDSR